MTIELRFTTYTWRARFKLRLSWGSRWFQGSLAIPFCRLAVWIYLDDATNLLSVP
jgi:hypothetical protein